MKNKQVEVSKRKAAGLASSTQGRSRVFKDKTKYDRKREKAKMSDPLSGFWRARPGQLDTKELGWYTELTSNPGASHVPRL